MPVKDECDQEADSVPMLPAAFESATLMMTQDHQRVIRLSFALPLPDGWKVCPDGVTDPLIDSQGWKNLGSPPEVEVPWLGLAAPSGLEVHLAAERVAAWWPINISDSSALPPPEELRNLPLDLLLEILTSSAPLHRVVMRWRERQEELRKNKFEASSSLDALSRINVGSFLLQRTRRVSSALLALRRSLERPIASEESLSWRIGGPVGVDAVMRAIEIEARSLEERVFLLTELALELERVRPCESPFGPTAEDVRQEIRQVCVRIGAKIEMVELPQSSRIRSYAKNAFKRST